MYSYCDGGGGEGAGGGGGGGSYGDSNEGPNVGDTKVDTDADGKKSIKEYRCFENGACDWVTVKIILPAATVEADRITYVYIPLYASHRQVALSETDGFVYTYDANGGEWIGEPTIIIGGPDPNAKPISNIKKHLECFKANVPATLTIYVDQPNHGKADCYNSSNYSNVGHTFLGIEQDGTTRTIGFYPKERAWPGDMEDASQLKDNAGKNYDISVSFFLNSQEFSYLLDYITNGTPSLYHLNDFNCTDWVVQAVGTVGINLPQNKTAWISLNGLPIGYSLCPGQFGQDLLNLSTPGKSHQITKIPEEGKAPINNGSCTTPQND